jgi:hypothetical protein
VGRGGGGGHAMQTDGAEPRSEMAAEGRAHRLPPWRGRSRATAPRLYRRAHIAPRPSRVLPRRVCIQVKAHGLPPWRGRRGRAPLDGLAQRRAVQACGAPPDGTACGVVAARGAERARAVGCARACRRGVGWRRGGVRCSRRCGAVEHLVRAWVQARACDIVWGRGGVQPAAAGDARRRREQALLPAGA